MQGCIGSRAVPCVADKVGAPASLRPGLTGARRVAAVMALLAPIFAAPVSAQEATAPAADSLPRLQFASTLNLNALAMQPAPTAPTPEAAFTASASPQRQASIAPMTSASVMPPAAATNEPTLRLGTGDAVVVQVFGRPEFNTTAYVSEDQTILVPLAGSVRVGGLSPADAATQVAEALRAGEYLVDPQVSVTFSQFRSQQVSVLGEVHTPGRYPIESKTSVLDMLAQAGGVSEVGADTIVLIRPGADGKTQRIPVDLKKLTSGASDDPAVGLKGGDSLFVPRAEQYYVYGEVQTPNMYRLESGTTVVQAISRSGGLTPRGSDRRIEIKRQVAEGKYKTFDAELGDPVKPNDVIRVKERLF